MDETDETPAATLGRYIDDTAVTNRGMAQRIQRLRRHPSIPSAAEISHWRCGRSVPQHDMRVWIELATEGAVSMEAWEDEKRRRKEQRHERGK